MIRAILRASAIITVGTAAELLGYVIVPKGEALRDEGHVGEMVRDLDDLSKELLEALQRAERAEAERDDLVRLARRVAYSRAGSDSNTHACWEIAAWLTSRALEGREGEATG